MHGIIHSVWGFGEGGISSGSDVLSYTLQIKQEVLMKKLFMFLFLIITMASLACNTVTSLPARLLDTPAVECSQFNLTPEECANVGTHQYTTSEKVLFDQTGQTCQTGSDDVTISITFLTNDTFLYSNTFV